jgi:hypothetical protein
MLIVAVSVAAVLATAPGVDAANAATPANSIPSMVVRVATDSDVPPSLVVALLAEADAIWRGTGMQFFWEREPGERESRAPVRVPSPFGPPTLHVTIGQDRHAIAGGGREFALGWIVFDDVTTPQREIYLSYTNANALLESASSVVGPVQWMPPLQREILLARAMGRALAHELGHYLSASKAHSHKGLMKAVHSASELFGLGRSLFQLTPDERQRMAARFASVLMASRG